jgi:hypothetical protein
MDDLVVQGEISGRIFTLRGKEIMLDRDLAALYKVETKVLNQAVKRNIKRFPSDFMFQVSEEEFEKLRSQTVTSNEDRMGLRRAPYAFTEQGVYILATVLPSTSLVVEHSRNAGTDSSVIFVHESYRSADADNKCIKGN